MTVINMYSLPARQFVIVFAYFFHFKTIANIRNILLSICTEDWQYALNCCFPDTLMSLWGKIIFRSGTGYTWADKFDVEYLGAFFGIMNAAARSKKPCLLPHNGILNQIFGSLNYLLIIIDFIKIKFYFNLC